MCSPVQPVWCMETDGEDLCGLEPSEKWPWEEEALEGWTQWLVWWEASSVEECVIESFRQSFRFLWAHLPLVTVEKKEGKFMLNLTGKRGRCYSLKRGF